MYSKDLPWSAIPADRLPKPQGYKILIALPTVEAQTKGGLFLPEKLKGEEEIASILGYVVSVGPEAYSDPARTSYAWCKEGDWVMFRPYSGTRFKIDGHEFRLINDDTVEAVSADPEGYKRA